MEMLQLGQLGQKRCEDAPELTAHQTQRLKTGKTRHYHLHVLWLQCNAVQAKVVQAVMKGRKSREQRGGMGQATTDGVV
jgi:hypothetical protein